MNKVAESLVNYGSGRFGLSEGLLASIIGVLSQYNNVDQALVYGSRALGTYKQGSDIDLCLKLHHGRSMTLEDFNRLRWKLDDLMSPYLFDVSIYQQIENPALLERIDRAGQVIYP